MGQRRPLQILRHMLGLQPECFVIHTLERRLRHFKADQHELALRNLAAHLATTNLAGVYRESWFLDPQVAQLTPTLGFLTAVPLANGARLFNKGAASPGMFADALDKSPQRKAAYDAGTYQPRVYVYFWPRKAMLHWAERSPNGAPAPQ